MTPLLIVVDDDPDDIDFFSFALKEVDSNCELKFFLSGKDFLNFYRSVYESQQEIAIVVDINMPAMSGIELLSILNHDHLVTRHPVIVVTTAQATSHESECMKLGAKKYYTKPVCPTDWKTIVVDILKMAC